VTDAARTCPSCAALWRWQEADHAWARIHAFPAPARAGSDDGAGPFPPVQPDALVMAHDGLHGWFRWSNEPGLLMTDDGGESWRAVDGPWRGDGVLRVLVDANDVYVATVADCSQEHCRERLWRAPVDRGAWHPVDLPAAVSASDLGVRSGVMSAPDWDPGGIAGRRNTGEGWQPVTGPHGLTACRLETGFVREVVVCSTGAGAELDRLLVRAPHHAWRELVLPAPFKGARRVTWVLSGNDRDFLVGTDRGTVVTSTDGTHVAVAAPLLPDDTPDPGAFVDDVVGQVLVDGDRLLRTEDGGRTWSTIAGS
jgi:hypothetical protein